MAAAATIAARQHETGTGAVEDKDDVTSLENMRAKIPVKENREAELVLSVLVLG